MQEYSLKFNKLSKHASSLISNPRDEMRYFVMGVFNDIVDEYSVAMLHDNIHVSRLMVNAQQDE